MDDKILTLLEDTQRKVFLISTALNDVDVALNKLDEEIRKICGQKHRLSALLDVAEHQKKKLKEKLNEQR